ncbi:MAG: hypothetical protein WBP64_04395 [Nitrososphaeraceae archaeon]
MEWKIGVLSQCPLPNAYHNNIPLTFLLKIHFGTFSVIDDLFKG